MLQVNRPPALLSTLLAALASRPVPRPAVALFFGALLAAGLAVHRDFGVGWDEENNRRYGSLTLDYITGRDRAAPHFTDPQDFWNPVSGQFARTHGPLVEVPLVLLERLLSLDTPRDYLLMRHALGFCLFWLGCVLLYLLAHQALGSRRLAMLGSLMLMLSPRLFSHAFHNSVDIPLLTAYTLALLTLLRLHTRPTLAAGLLHGAACAALIAIRQAGVVVPAMTLGLLALDLALRPRRAARLRVLALPVAAFAVAAPLLVWLLWPMLWEAPLSGFAAAFRTAANDPWTYSEVYLGAMVSARSVPWHFTPVWMLVTTPPLYSLLALAGLAALLAEGLGRPRRTLLQKPGLVICLAGSALPLVSVAALGSTLFNGWRHLYFVYPGVLVLGLYGLSRLGGLVETLAAAPRLRTLARAAGCALVLSGLAATALFMVRAHPQQLSYFNLLTGGVSGGARRFQVGYWGPEYREALEQVVRLNQHNDGVFNIFLTDNPAPLLPVRFNHAILEKKIADRLGFSMRLEDSRYFLTNHNSHVLVPGPVEGGTTVREVWSRVIDGARVVSVYELARR